MGTKAFFQQVKDYYRDIKETGPFPSLYSRMERIAEGTGMSFLARRAVLCIHRAEGTRYVDEYIKCTEPVQKEKIYTYMTLYIADWERKRGRTGEDVLALLDRAAECCDKVYNV